MLREVVTPTPLVREAIAATWALRTQGEREAERRFMGLARALGRAGGPEDIQGLALRACVDESRHASLCARLARAYGARVDAKKPEAASVDAADLAPEDAALTEVVSLCCIAETLSVAVFGAILESAGPRDIRDVAESILHDEAFHAELGWTHLAAQRAAGRGDFLGAILPGLLASGIPAELLVESPVLGDGADADQALTLGLLPAARHWALVRETLESVILPRFDAAGIQTAAAKAWVAEWTERNPPAR